MHGAGSFYSNSRPPSSPITVVALVVLRGIVAWVVCFADGLVAVATKRCHQEKLLLLHLQAAMKQF